MSVSDTLLGVGAFGRVFKGAYKDNDGQWTDVAVKQMKSATEISDIDLHACVAWTRA